MKEEMNSKADQAKEKIVEAVMKIIARDGIKSLTTRRLCEEAGVAKGTLYHHFENMDNVLAESMRFLHRHMLNLFENMQFNNLEEFFYNLGVASISAVEEQKKNGTKNFSFFDELVNNPVLYEVQKEQLKDWNDLICRKIKLLTKEEISEEVLKEISTTLNIDIAGFKTVLYFEDDLDLIKRLWKKHARQLVEHVNEEKWRDE
ncbi:MAG TPA: TetR/AcrR family transcriptional regulator [bacterium]|nr:TetR/AcrR family transcriptional regulator [bacterium]HPS30903.1 TetR/AcrR family transcriptional regulator [bacterium]